MNFWLMCIYIYNEIAIGVIIGHIAMLLIKKKLNGWVMKVKIITSKHCNPEFKALEYFLLWQKVSMDVEYDYCECIRITGGKPAPCMIIDGFVYGIGFMSIVNKFEKDGMKLC